MTNKQVATHTQTGGSQETWKMHSYYRFTALLQKMLTYYALHGTVQIHCAHIPEYHLKPHDIFMAAHYSDMWTYKPIGQKE